MSLAACAALVERGDPDRFLSTMAAPVAAREVLFPLYAFNLEVARAPWVTEEPMIAEMRLQWWRDALDEITQAKPVRTHEVTTPLAQILTPGLAQTLDALVEARRWDIYKDPFEDEAAFDRHIDHTAGHLMWVAARTLGQADEGHVRDVAYAQGVANWLRAIPELEARKRIPLLDGRPEGIRALATKALDKLTSAQAHRHALSASVRPALLAAWEAKPILMQAIKAPHRVAEGTLGQSPARKRLSLMTRVATGRW